MKAPLIALSVSAVGVLLALGICAGNHNRGFGLLLFFGCLLALVISVLWLVIALIVGRDK